MTVKELIEFLQTKPQHIQVAIRMYSEQELLEARDIAVRKFCSVRDDGWVHDARPDKPSEDYLLFPGN